MGEGGGETVREEVEEGGGRDEKRRGEVWGKGVGMQSGDGLN